jgi:biopolymer transport protein ExbB
MEALLPVPRSGAWDRMAKRIVESMALELKSHASILLRLGAYCLSAIVAVALLWSLNEPGKLLGQEADNSQSPGPSSEPTPAESNAPADESEPAAAEDKSLNVLRLAVSGGVFMIPIAAMSLLAVTMAFERALALRKQRVLPRGLVRGLGEMAESGGSFDPRKAYRLCQQNPSAAADVIEVMLLRVGRPLPEVETAVSHASQREADRLYSNVRWLNLAASLSTMLGLIGTIQGMIMAFHRLTVMDVAADRTTVLADGIYTALVTTFAGLFVAIPSLLASHYFEGRIIKLFHQIDELALQLMPQLERYEGRVRFGRQGGNGDEPTGEPPIIVEQSAK